MAFDETDEIPEEITALPQSKPEKPSVALYALIAGTLFLILLLLLAY